jgi:hypothetical protein
MLTTISYGLTAALVLLIALGLVRFFRDCQKGEWAHADWTSDQRKRVRTIRTVVAICIAVAWAAALAAIVHRPALIREPLLISIILNPSLLTIFALNSNNPNTLESARQTWGDRKLMILGTILCGCVLVGSLLAALNAWTARPWLT